MIATHWLSVYAMTLGIALSGGCAVAQPRRAVSETTTPFDKIATFSIVAVDPVSGVCGAAVASKYPAVAKVVPFVKGGVGAFCTQHFHHPEFGDRALGLLTAGKAPQDVLAELLCDDEGAGGRQLAIIDRAGRTAQHNPDTAGLGSRWWGAASGRFYACQGNTLVGPQVITAMAAAYEETAGSLADRCTSVVTYTRSRSGARPTGADAPALQPRRCAPGAGDDRTDVTPTAQWGGAGARQCFYRDSQ